ncbi:quinolinate synthase NadA [bacterium SCSIO 12643]|nr:quinolinate synthase NadA [bacterium SCSIO 12643]
MEIKTKKYIVDPKDQELADKITRLKKEKNAVILAHYYQVGPIQDVADFVGDSLALSRKAEETDADIIVFAGVHFMGETAKILNPTKKVVIPDMEAGCSLADSCPPEDFGKFKEKYPDHLVISYINCTADIKAMTDIICTSSNARKIVESLPKDQKIIFAPDKNLGQYLVKELDREMVLWDGVCIVHESFDIEKLLKLVEKHPDAHIIAHPESAPHILEAAEFVGSTTGLLNYVKESSEKKFIVATEPGILHEMQRENPDKILMTAPVGDDESCNCSECPYMKLNTMQKLYDCLKDESPEIVLDEELRKKALTPIKRMLEIS